MTHITIDAVDAVEAAELCEFIDTWLAQAPPAVIDQFNTWAHPYTAIELRAELVALATSLAGARPQPEGHLS
jgi:hypothetical protein